MSKANQIQIGMLGVIIVLLTLQLTGVVGGGSSNSSLRAQERQNLVNPTSAINPNSSVTPATPTATPPTAQPTAPVNTGPTTVMSFNEEVYDFGTVTDGEKVEHTFKFTNTGKEPLIISNAKGSCGCTVPKWPKAPIAPGATSEIVVQFDSKNKVGKRNQQVTITANTEPANTIIRLTGEVLAANGGTATNSTSPIQVQPK